MFFRGVPFALGLCLQTGVSGVSLMDTQSKLRSVFTTLQGEVETDTKGWALPGRVLCHSLQLNQMCRD